MPHALPLILRRSMRQPFQNDARPDAVSCRRFCHAARCRPAAYADARLSAAADADGVRRYAVIFTFIFTRRCRERFFLMRRSRCAPRDARNATPAVCAANVRRRSAPRAAIMRRRRDDDAVFTRCDVASRANVAADASASRRAGFRHARSAFHAFADLPTHAKRLIS